MEFFAERIKQLRREAGLSQGELAKKIGVTQRKISYWENGQIEPDLATIDVLCNYFGVSADYLLGRT
ncbi:MAG: helix-turn-helix domain-containing protein, partial [Christensenellaceae bacterium]